MPILLVIADRRMGRGVADGVGEALDVDETTVRP
jgi:phage shock protein PspC (stress-responsive transcriptional regulator)